LIHEWEEKEKHGEKDPQAEEEGEDAPQAHATTAQAGHGWHPSAWCWFSVAARFRRGHGRDRRRHRLVDL
jgi:hypothetical protein